LVGLVRMKHMTSKSSHIWSEWIVPIGIFIFISIVAWRLNHFNLISDTDAFTLFMVSAIACAYWKEYEEVKADRKKHPLPLNKPAKDDSILFTQKFYFSTWKLYVTIISSLFLIFCGIYVLSIKVDFYLVPAILILLGANLFVTSLKRLYERRPQFQISETHIWTVKLGAVSTKDIKKMVFRKMLSGARFTWATYWLDIYSNSNTGLYPDDSIYLKDIKDYKGLLRTLNPQTEDGTPWQQKIASYFE
jgi:hypothetical protein